MTAFLLCCLIACAPLQSGASASNAVFQPTYIQPAYVQPAGIQRPASQQSSANAQNGLPPLAPPPRDLPLDSMRPIVLPEQPRVPVQMSLTEQDLSAGSSGALPIPVQRTASLPPVVSRLETGVAGPDSLVICPPLFFDAIQPWIRYREQQGHRLLVVKPEGSAFRIKQMIRDVAAGGTLKHVVIVGDCGDRRRDSSNMVPTDYVKAEVNVQFGSEPEIATDSTYADINNDGSPDVSIGRLPVDTPAELTALINRIIRYESSDSCGAWQRRINLVAGVGGFGHMIDRMIEQTTRQIVTDLIPPEFDTSMTYGSWTSPYCPDPRRFSETVVARFNEGCLFWVYIGHGSRHQLDEVYLPDQTHGILDLETVQNLECESGNPIAIFLACYTGAADDPRDCLAEEMMRQDKGPIAVISGTRVTMPYAMSLLSLEMLREYFDGQSQTIGELIMVGKQRLVRESRDDDPYRNMIDGLGSAMSPLPELLARERLEHVYLINLLGDPLLRLRRCGEMPLAVTPRAHAGETVEITGHIPDEGILCVDISYERDRHRHRPPRRNEYDSTDAALSGYQAAYERAHNLVCFEEQMSAPSGPFSRRIRLPEDATGECHIRAMLITDEETVVGSAPINIRPQTADDEGP
ncbi:MAG: C25 family cysteine peptidase [Planctomycetota bacterium]